MLTKKRFTVVFELFACRRGSMRILAGLNVSLNCKRNFQIILIYLERSQNPDGGFYFSPVNPEINKAGESSGGGFASYGTTTADGVLALRAVGVPDDDPRIAKAIKWLEGHHQPDRAPGFDQRTDQPWDSGLRFYYAHAISRILPRLPVKLPPQVGDGSFRNSNNLAKEDDPLIATAFTLYVMARND